MRRRLGWIIVLLLVAGAVGAIYWFYFRGAAQPKAAFETATVDRGQITAQLMATGNLSPLVTVQVGSQVSGRIRDLYVDFNAIVKKGQVIAKIDPQIFQAAVEQARANQLSADAGLVKAKVQLADAQRVYSRTKALASRKLVAPADEDTSRATYDGARAQVAGAEAAVVQARATLNQARINLAYTTIVSPIHGVVISRNVDVGQTVAASLQAPTLFTIAEDLSKMQVHTSVAEADIGRIKESMAITFAVDAYPKERFKGTVWQVRNSPQTVQNVVTYDVVVNVDNTDLRLKPGMTANVTFVYARAEDVLRLPNAALRFKPPPELLAKLRGRHSGGGAEGVASAALAKAKRRPPASRAPGAPASQEALATDERHVWVLRDGLPRRVTVRVGITDGTRSAIVAGPLRDGDELLLEMSGGPATKGMFGGPGPGRGRGVIRHL